jgi:hypothetical protein
LSFLIGDPPGYIAAAAAWTLMLVVFLWKLPWARHSRLRLVGFAITLLTPSLMVQTGPVPTFPLPMLLLWINGSLLHAALTGGADAAPSSWLEALFELAALSVILAFASLMAGAVMLLLPTLALSFWWGVNNAAAAPTARNDQDPLMALLLLAVLPLLAYSAGLVPWDQPTHDSEPVPTAITLYLLFLAGVLAYLATLATLRRHPSCRTPTGKVVIGLAAFVVCGSVVGLFVLGVWPFGLQPRLLSA